MPKMYSPNKYKRNKSLNTTGRKRRITKDDAID